MKDWTQKESLLVLYAVGRWTKDHYNQICYTTAIFVSGVYVGIILTQGI